MPCKPSVHNDDTSSPQLQPLLKPATMNHIDQTITLWLNGSDSLYLDQVALTATHTATWIPAALVLAYALIRHNDLLSFVETLLAIALCILLADQVASSVCKPLFARFRPAQDPLIMYTVDVVNGYRGGLYGFFSSHASNTFAVATFLTLLIRNRALSLWLYSWALVNCWSRVYLGVHYIGDLTVGAIWGTLVGWGIYLLWLRYCHHSVIWEKYHAATQSTSSSNLTAGGYSYGSVHLIISTLALTYLYIAFRAIWA